MKVIVIGLGSMGKRRIRLLMKIGNIEIAGVDTNKERADEVKAEYGIDTFETIETAVLTFEPLCAFVCTSPISHAGIINTCLKHKLNVFTEINLVDDMYEENIALAKKMNVKLFLSSSRLYKLETEFISKRVHECRGPFNYIYHIGQYLPDWHPWESYNSYFIGDRRTNGCREIFAIELPWVVTCFGKIVKCEVMSGKNTGLNIDYNDNYTVLFEHENGTRGTMVVDVVSRKAVRYFEAFGEDLYVSWNGTPDSLKEYDFEAKKDIPITFGDEEHVEGYAAFITEKQYMREIEAFLDNVAGKPRECLWDFERDKEILKLIDRIEE